MPDGLEKQYAEVLKGTEPEELPKLAEHAKEGERELLRSELRRTRAKNVVQAATIEMLRAEVADKDRELSKKQKKGYVFEWPEDTKMNPAQREQIMFFLTHGDIAGLDNYLDHLIRYDDKLPTLLKHTYFKDEVMKVYGRHFKRRDLPSRRGNDTMPGFPVQAIPSGSTTMGAMPGSGRLGIIFLDLDNFKQLNDTKGHLAGDAALIKVAELITEGLREADIKGRFGGEEIEIAVEIENEADHYLVAEKIRKIIEGATIEFGGEKFKVTASLGAAEYRPGESLDDLIDRANWAMKYAKAKGKNQVAPDDVDEIRAWVDEAKKKEAERKRRAGDR